MAATLDNRGVAFMAGGQEPLDGGATMTVVSAIEILERDRTLEPEQYLCPVRFEDENGNLVRRIMPDKVQALVAFLNRGKERLFDRKVIQWDEADPIVKLAGRPGMADFVTDAVAWLRKCAEQHRPVFVREIEVGRIAVKPEWEAGPQVYDPTEPSVE